jgi:hypothetical protein
VAKPPFAGSESVLRHPRDLVSVREWDGHSPRSRFNYSSVGSARRFPIERRSGLRTSYASHSPRAHTKYVTSEPPCKPSASACQAPPTTGLATTQSRRPMQEHRCSSSRSRRWRSLGELRRHDLRHARVAFLAAIGVGSSEISRDSQPQRLGPRSPWLTQPQLLNSRSQYPRRTLQSDRVPHFWRRRGHDRSLARGIRRPRRVQARRQSQRST